MMRNHIWIQHMKHKVGVRVLKEAPPLTKAKLINNVDEYRKFIDFVFIIQGHQVPGTQVRWNAGT